MAKPFVAGNAIIARLCVNVILLSHGLPIWIPQASRDSIFRAGISVDDSDLMSVENIERNIGFDILMQLDREIDKFTCALADEEEERSLVDIN